MKNSQGTHFFKMFKCRVHNKALIQLFSSMNSVPCLITVFFDTKQFNIGRKNVQLADINKCQHLLYSKNGP